MEDRTDLMARRSVSRIEGQCTNQEVYQAQRPRCGSFALSNSAVWIIRTIHLTMAQVIESEIRKCEVPYPLLGGEGHIRVILELAVEAGWFSRCHRYCHGGFPGSYPFQ